MTHSHRNYFNKIRVLMYFNDMWLTMINSGGLINWLIDRCSAAIVAYYELLTVSLIAIFTVVTISYSLLYSNL